MNTKRHVYGLVDIVPTSIASQSRVFSTHGVCGSAQRSCTGVVESFSTRGGV